MAEGGLKRQAEKAEIKSKMMWDLIDNSDGFYTNRNNKKYRSRMNITFRVKDSDELEMKFKEEAAK